MLLRVILLVQLLAYSNASLSLLGIKTGGLGSSGPSEPATATLPTTFAVDASNPSLTKLQGKALHFNVDALEVAALDGLLRLGRSHAQFEKDGAVWKKTVERNSVGHYHNNRRLLHMEVSADSVEASKLNFAGSGAFYDIILTDPAKMQDISANLCKADRIFLASAKNSAESTAALEHCAGDMQNMQFSLSALLDYSSKVHGLSASRHREALQLLQSLQEQIVQLSSVAAVDPVAEKEKVRGIMTEFEAVVDAVRLELANRVKAVKAGLEDLQGQHTAIEGTVAAMGTDIAERVQGAVLPLEAHLTALDTRIPHDLAALNATVDSRLAQAALESQQAIQDVSDAVNATAGNLASLSNAVADIEGRLGWSVSELGADLASSEQRLSGAIGNVSEAWGAALNSSVSDLRAEQERLTNNASAVWLQLADLARAGDSQQQQLQNLMTAVADTETRTARLVTTSLRTLNESTTQLLNESLAALHSEVMAEFSLTSRENTAALEALKTDLRDEVQHLNSSLADRVSAVERGVEEASTAHRSLVEAAETSLRGELGNATQQWQDSHSNLAGTVERTAAQLRAELGNTTLHYHNLSAAAVAELTANTSQVVARSNSILARAIGDVNNSVLHANATLWTRLMDVRAELGEEFKQALLDSAERNDAAHTELAAFSAQSLQRAEDGLRREVEKVNETALSRLSLLETGLWTELTALAEAHERDTSATRNATAESALATAQRIAEVESTLGTQVAALNASTTQGLHSLSAQLLQAAVNHSALVATNSQTLTDAFVGNLSAAELRWSAELQSTAQNLTDSLTTKTDKLRYALSGLNNTQQLQRVEDQTALSAALALQDEARNRVQRNLTALIAVLRVDLEASTASLASNIGAVERKLEEGLRRHEVALDNATSILSAAVDTADTRLNSSIAQTESDLRRVNASLVAELGRLRDEAAESGALMAQAARTALELEVERLQVAIDDAAAVARATANRSTHALDTALRQLVSSTATALSDETARGLSSLNATLSTATQQAEDQRQVIASSLRELRDESRANVSAVNSTMAARTDELSRLLAALNGTVTAARLEAARALSQASAEVLGAVTSVNGSVFTVSTAASARMDGLESRLQRVNDSAAAKLNDLAVQIVAVRAAADAKVNVQRVEAEGSIRELRAEAHKNMSSVEAALQGSFRKLNSTTNNALERTTSALTTRISEMHSESAAALQALDATHRKDFAALNSSLLSESRARETAHSSLSAELRAHVANHTTFAARTNHELQGHSSAIRAQANSLAAQQEHLVASLVNFTAQQAKKDADLLQLVDERVTVAEVQQRLGAVAVEGVRNETSRLFHIVASATDRVAAAELQAAVVQGELAHLQRQHTRLEAAQGNITATVLPEIFTKIGALQQSTTDLTVRAQGTADAVAALRESTEGRHLQHSAAAAEATSRVDGVERELERARSRFGQAVTELQQQHSVAAIIANSTAEKQRLLADSLTAVAADARLGVTLQPEVADLGRRMQAQELKITSLTAALEEGNNTNDAAVRALRESVDAQASQIRDLQDALSRQQAEVRALQEENRRLLREGATTESTDELRKLLFDLQGQMLTHTSKVLDLLLQPRTAVLVNPSEGAGVSQTGR